MLRSLNIVNLTMWTVGLMLQIAYSIAKCIYKWVLKPVWRMLKPELIKARDYAGNKIRLSFDVLCGAIKYIGFKLKYAGKMLFLWLFFRKKYVLIKEDEKTEAEEHSNVSSFLAYKMRKEAEQAKSNVEQARKSERRCARD